MRELEELRVERFFEANEVDRLGRWLHVDVFGADRILSSIQDVVHARETNHSEVIVDAGLNIFHEFNFLRREFNSGFLTSLF